MERRNKKQTVLAGKLILILASVARLFAQQPVLDDAAKDFEEGRTAEAGKKLDLVLKNHPADLRALVLKGAVLDSLQRYADAEVYYRRAEKIAPDSPQVLNNEANHYLASGNRRRARELFLKVLTLEPRHINANLQLAQLSVDERHGSAALVYLDHLGDSAGSEPGVVLLRGRALALAGKCGEAAQILEHLEMQPDGGPGIYFSIGMAFADCKQYDHAESSFSRALDADPKDFSVLYNLGLAALAAGHSERARNALEIAYTEHPEDVDCLLALARVYLKEERPLDGARLLAKAQKVAPERADLLLLLAQVLFHLEFYEDAADSYTRYLKRKPDDDAARRERGMALACANQPASALADLEWYVHKHTDDAMGFYELAVAEQFVDRPKAFAALDRALGIDPSMIQAHYTRAVLNIEDQKSAAAIDDLRLVLNREPANYRVLVHLGQAYLGVDRAAEAADVLKHAIDLAPDQPAALIQYRRALEKLGRKDEAAAVLASLKQADSSAHFRRPQAGLIDFLSLSSAEQRARYRENLRKYAEASPEDPRWRIRLGRELLTEGKVSEAEEVFGALQLTLSDPELLELCGNTLLEFEQYHDAKQFLEKALAAAPDAKPIRLELTIATFHTQGAEAALTELEKTPAAQQQGDYYLLRAQILDAQGRTNEAADALNQGMYAAPTRPELYLQAAGFLLKHKLYEKALKLLEQASHILPDDRELLLTQTVTLAMMPRDEDALKLLTKLQARWPEWDRPYLLNGMLLEIQHKSAEALLLLETAIALGANTPEAYYYQALAITHTRPDDLQSAQDAISHAVALTTNDPYISLLAGKISLERKDYPAAVQQLVQATHLLPTLIPAHYALSEAYAALGDETKSAAEIDAIQHIADQNAVSDKSPLPVEDFIFRVQPSH